MRFSSILCFAACGCALATVVTPAHAAGPRLITVDVEWRLDASAAPPPSATGAPMAGVSVAVPKAGEQGTPAEVAAAGTTAALSVTVAEDSLASATYHSAEFGDLLVTVKPHINADQSVFANILVRRTFDSAKTQVSTSQSFKGGAFVLLGRTSFPPPFASPGQVYAKGYIASDFKDPFAPHADMGSGEAK